MEISQQEIEYARELAVIRRAKRGIGVSKDTEKSSYLKDGGGLEEEPEEVEGKGVAEKAAELRARIEQAKKVAKLAKKAVAVAKKAGWMAKFIAFLAAGGWIPVVIILAIILIIAIIMVVVIIQEGGGETALLLFNQFC